MKVLVLTHRLPYAPNRGDRIRAYHLLRTLAGSHDVHVFSLAEPEETRELAGMRQWLASVEVAHPSPLRNKLRAALSLAGSRPLTHTLLDAPDLEPRVAAYADSIQPDVVLAYCTGMARLTVDGALKHLPSVLDMVDVDSAKWAALSATAAMPMRWIYAREARLMREFEIRACRHSKTTLVVNQREQATLQTMVPDASIVAVENGIDVHYFTPPGGPSARPRVVFCGVMDYAPNVEGVRWFGRDIWPRVRNAVPDATFTIVGARPTRVVQALAAGGGIEVTGAVDDVRPYLWDAAVSVAPLLTARGLQNKVLEALAAGLPVVTTAAVAEGLPAAALPGCEVANDAQTFAGALATLLAASADERRARSAKASLTGMAWESKLAPVAPILVEAAGHQERDRVS